MLTLVNGRRLTAGDFEARGGAVLLSAAGRKVVIKGIEDRLATEVVHPTFKYKVTYRRAIELQARVLAAHIMGELPAYQPFSTR